MMIYLLSIMHFLPLSTLHLPDTGSGLAMLIKGGSSRKPMVRWNFSGTPWGGTWLSPGQTMSLISRPCVSFFHDCQTPIYKYMVFLAINTEQCCYSIKTRSMCIQSIHLWVLGVFFPPPHLAIRVIINDKWSIDIL